MVICICENCNYKLSLTGDEKYLVCKNCGERYYVRDLEIELEEVNIKVRSE